MFRLLTPFLLSLLYTALLTPAVIWLARRLNWVARPRDDRWHQRPTALMGGIGIFLGTVAAWLLTGSLTAVAPVAVPAAFIFLLGAVDDRLRLRPHSKLIGQLAAAGVLILSGVTFPALPHALAVPATLFWVVGITNAVNLLDNMDGLAAGVCGIAALAMAGCCILEGDMATAVLALALAGACAGFLIYNFNPARIFMGDCGSMFLGFTLAALGVRGTYRIASDLMLSLLVPVAILAIPIFDTTLVSVARTLHGRSISQGGRDHTSHRLVTLGLSERGTVIAFYIFAALFGGVALLATRESLPVVLLVAVLLFIGLMVIGLYLGLLKVYGEDAEVPPHVRILGGTVLFKKQVLQLLLDMMLIPIALLGAQLLRFEGTLPDDITKSMLTLFPVVLVAKLTGMHLCKAYRGVWRYAGMVDVLAAVAGSTVGSLLAAGCLWALTGFMNVSRAALIIDWMFFTLLAVAARLGYVALQHVFGMLSPREGPRVLILGAGAEALTLIRRLRDPFSPDRAQVVGILDDDEGKRGRSVNGVPVLGGLDTLPAKLAEHGVTRCMLGQSPYSAEGEAILARCRQHGVSVYYDMAAPAPVAEPARPVAV